MVLWYLNGARYYDPTIRRFITPDTIVQAPYDPQSLNRYAYVRNNPLIYTDPSGNFAILGFAVVVNPWALLAVGIAYGLDYMAREHGWNVSVDVPPQNVASTNFGGGGSGGNNSNNYQSNGPAYNSPLDMNSNYPAYSTTQTNWPIYAQNSNPNQATDVSYAPSDYLLFNGNYLMWYNNGEINYSWPATSGRKEYQNPKYQNLPFKGPIPEGHYLINPNKTDRFSYWDIRDYDWYGSRARSAWGNIRTPIEPFRSTNTYGRGGFFMHGGYEAGSAGCVDLTYSNEAFHYRLQQYNMTINLIVDYPNWP